MDYMGGTPSGHITHPAEAMLKAGSHDAVGDVQERTSLLVVRSSQLMRKIDVTTIQDPCLASIEKCIEDRGQENHFLW